MQTEAVIREILVLQLSHQNQEILLQLPYRRAQGMADTAALASTHHLAKGLQG